MLSFSVVPERPRAVVAEEISPYPFANRSTFPTGTALVVDLDLHPAIIVNVSTFGLHRITTGDDFDLLQTSFTNTSSFGAPEVAEAPPDGTLRPTGFTNTSSFGAHSLDRDSDGAGASAGTSTANATGTSIAAAAGSASGTSTGAATGGSAGYALIANAIAQGSGNPSTATTGAVDTTGSNLIVLFTVGFGGPATPTDSKGNTWTGLTEQVASSVHSRLWYCSNPTVGTGHTFSVVNGSFPAIAAAAFSGAASSSVLDQQNGATSASTTSLSCGSVTPSQNNELVVCGLGDSVTTTASIDSGQTITNQATFIGSTAFSAAMSYEIQTTATTRNPAWSWSGAARAEAVIATFK